MLAGFDSPTFKMQNRLLTDIDEFYLDEEQSDQDFDNEIDEKSEKQTNEFGQKSL